MKAVDKIMSPDSIVAYGKYPTMSLGIQYVNCKNLKIKTILGEA